jgi:hypothetical protein
MKRVLDQAKVFASLRVRQLELPLAVFVSLIVLNTYSSLLLLPRLFPVRSAVIAVDMQVEAGNNVEIYLNNGGDPLRQAVVPRQRVQYLFSGITEDISVLRLDPTDVSAADVKVYSVQVRDAGALLRNFDPAALAGWLGDNLKSPEIADGAFHFLAANNDPILLSRVDIALHHSGDERWSALVSKLPTAEFLPVLITSGFALYIIAGLFTRTRWVHLPLVWLTLAAAGWLIPAVARNYHGLNAAGTAVGMATYYGRSLSAVRLAFFSAVAAAILLSLGLALLVRWIRKSRVIQEWMDRDTWEAAPAAYGWANAVIPAVVVCLLGIALFPNLRDILTAVGSQQFPQQWDSNNITYWAYLAHSGFVPFRDFWYIYDGFYIFAKPLPWGVILRFLYLWALFGVFFVAFYRLSRNKVGGALFATAVMLIGERSVMFGNAFRYMLAIDVVLSFLIIDTTCPRWRKRRICFWLSFGLALFFEPVQLIYAAPAIATTLLFDYCQRQPRSWHVWRGRLLSIVAVPATTIVVLAIWLAVHGQLLEFLQFNLRLSDTTAYAAVPTDIVSELKKRFAVASLPVLAAPLLIAVGLWERMVASGKNTRYPDAVLGLGLTIGMITQKHLVRDMGLDTLGPIVAALLVCIFAWHGRRSWLQYLLGSIVAGGFAFLMVQAGSAASLLGDIVAGPHRVADTLRLMISEQKLLDQANQGEYAPAHFALFHDEVKLEAWLDQNSNGGKPELFALTDDPILYILNRQAPVYYAALYNASPLRDQRRIAEWLAVRHPAYATLDPAMMVWDNVPVAVRCPLVIPPVVQDYVPDRVFGRLELLRRRRSDEAIPLPYWRDKFGGMLNLGHIPRVSSFSKFSPCSAGGNAGCEDFLRVQFRAVHPEPGTLVVPIEAEGLPFGIQMNTVPAENTYYVRLSRVWFWNIIKDNGGVVSVLKDRVDRNVSIDVISRRVRTDILY